MRSINLNEYRVPNLVPGTLARYLIHHIRPGSFIAAVLRNDLFEAIGRADRWSLLSLGGITGLIYNHLPIAVTREGYDKWIENSDQEWHDEVMRYYKDRWVPFLDKGEEC